MSRPKSGAIRASRIAKTNVVLAIVVLATVSFGCGTRKTVSRDDAVRIALSTLPFAELQIPDNSRPGGAEPSEIIPLPGPFREDGIARKGGKVKVVAPLPFRPRGMFFVKPQGGVMLHSADGEFVPYDKSGTSPERTWAHDRFELTLYEPAAGPLPTAGQYVLTNPKAAERERALNFSFSGRTDRAEFVWTEIADGWDTRHGLLLPAPGHAAWDLKVPPAAELSFVAGLVEPEIATGTASDGAEIAVEVEVGGTVTEVARIPVAIRSFTEQRIDVSRWSGQDVRLRLRSEPGPTAIFDYVFAGAPVVASRVANPVQVVLLYLDTLRPDHLTFYGYERDTSKNLDSWVEQAAVFSNARSIAPWTLPAARTAITGRHPEDYAESDTLPGLLRDRGWSTAMIAGNVYLMANFQMQRGWDLHRIDTWPPANEVADETLAWLAAHDGHDGLLQAQFMSSHLPYVEPEPYLHLYAGDMVRPLQKGFLVQDVRKANAGKRPEMQQYIIDRYDNNVRFLADNVRRIVDELDDNDYVVIYSDHGEELWDHQGFEHGHTLYDELLRVPLVIDGPGIDGARIDAKVSLLDLAPTVLDLVGEPIPANMVGRSLVPLLRGESGAADPFEQRDQAFGRPLYGFERWGVLHGDQKWTVFEGRETLFDLAQDAAEKHNRLKKEPSAGDPFPNYLSTTLGRPVVDAFRFVATPARAGTTAQSVWLLCSVPGGFTEAFLGNDALENSRVTISQVASAAEAARLLQTYGISRQQHAVPADAGAVQICWESGWTGTREAYLVPKVPLAEAGPQTVCSAYHGDTRGGARGTLRIPAGQDPVPGPPLARLPLEISTGDRPGGGLRTVSWTVGTVPVPSTTSRISGRDAESTQMLIELGYLTAEQAEHVESASGCAPPTQGR